MENSYRVIDSSSKTHITDYSIFKSPCRISGVVLGLIIIIGSVIAQGLTYSSLGPNSHIILIGVPVGIALIAGSYFYPRMMNCLRSDKKPAQEVRAIRTQVLSKTETLKFLSKLDGNTLTIGSESYRLDEKEIETELVQYKGRKDIEILIIYGDGVEFITDPGFVEMNPKKVILVGARIIRGTSEVEKLDDALANNNEWLAGIFSVNGMTRVFQFGVQSIEQAIQSKQEKHAVYLVLGN